MKAKTKFVWKQYNHKIPWIGRGCKPTTTHYIPKWLYPLVFDLTGYPDWKNCGYDLVGDTFSFLLTNLKYGKIDKLNPPDEQGIYSDGVLRKFSQ